jgi:hypothetical protein
MASANFNREIVSSDSNGRIKSYSLDKVINKDFEGPYEYNFNTEVPDGISLEGGKLSISPNVEFELSIVVTRSGVADPDSAVATTMIKIEETPVANFNTEIVSSALGGKTREYVLDEVIEKNFPGPYNYKFFRSDVASIDFAENDFVNIGFPKGLEIIENMKGQQVLSVGPNIEFELSIIVGNRNEMIERGAIATTTITIEGKPNFNKIKEEFYEKSNFGQKKEESAKDWSNIISQRTSSGEESAVIPR